MNWDPMMLDSVPTQDKETVLAATNSYDLNKVLQRATPLHVDGTASGTTPNLHCCNSALNLAGSFNRILSTSLRLRIYILFNEIKSGEGFTTPK